MPVSNFHGISSIMGEIERVSPRSVLDLGCGFGLFGAICRQTLDGRYGRCRANQWDAVIVGFESHEPYENPTWNTYTELFIDDFTREAHRHNGYDLVLMIDSLEHLTPEVGRPFLHGLVQRNRHVIVSVPNGRMEQGTTFGNEREAHLWTFNGVEEFTPYDFWLIHQSVCTVVSIKGELCT